MSTHRNQKQEIILVQTSWLTSASRPTLLSFMHLMSWRKFIVWFEVYAEKLCEIKIRNGRKQTYWNMFFPRRWIFTLRVGFVCMSSPLAWYLMVRLDLSMLRGYNVWDGSCQRAFRSVRILKFEMFVWNVLIDWRDYLKSTRENKNHPIYFFKLYGWVNSYACIRSFQGLKMYQFSVMVPVLSHFHRMSSWI